MHTLCPCSPSLLFSTSSSSSGSFYTSLSRPLPSPPPYRIMRSNGDKFILLSAIHSSKTVDLHPNNTWPVKALVLITSSSQHTNFTITTTIVVLLYWHEPPRNHLARERDPCQIPIPCSWAMNPAFRLWFGLRGCLFH